VADVGGLGGWGFYLPFPSPLFLPIIYLLPCRRAVQLAAPWLRLVPAVGILLGVLRGSMWRLLEALCGVVDAGLLGRDWDMGGLGD
jgi:hypothetical protein